jgi:hypothetical protein
VVDADEGVELRRIGAMQAHCAELGAVVGALHANEGGHGQLPFVDVWACQAVASVG